MFSLACFCLICPQTFHINGGKRIEKLLKSVLDAFQARAPALHSIHKVGPPYQTGLSDFYYSSAPFNVYLFRQHRDVTERDKSAIIE